MAVDTTEIASVYDVLIGKANETLDAQYESGRLKGADYAGVLSNALVGVLQLSVSSVQTQPSIDVDLLTKASQKTLIDKQSTTEEAKAALTTRQATAYDDQKRIKKAEVYGNVIGMTQAGGTVVDAAIWTKLDNAIAAI